MEHDFASGGEDTLAGTSANASQSARRHEALELQAGTTVGRYVVVSVLGAGAMGVVYAAYDPELDRKVAIKVLRSAKDEETDRTRLQREAQALGRLSHPNIVAVHDVGTVDEQIWLAMEFVEGKTLTGWLSETPRSWRAVVDVLRQAGRGLAAAHAAGLVHRDFKPDNVMVGNDRVRVMDFGLARVAGEEPAIDRPSEHDPTFQISALDRSVTQAGTVVGTPAYMAPEQIHGRATDARTDQFSFCVTLWEALYAERPYAGKTSAAVMTSVLEGRLNAPPSKADVPTWLHATLVRGLEADPDARWPSMDELLAALQRGQGRARMRRGGLALGLAAASAVAVVGWQHVQNRRAMSACEEVGAQIGEVWNDDVGHRVRTAFEASGVRHARGSVDRVVPRLEAHAEAWRRARTELCVHAAVENSWNEALVSRAAWCLEDRRMELRALIEQLEGGAPQTVHAAVEAAANLSPVDSCLDVEVLRRSPEPPQSIALRATAEQGGELASVRALLAEAGALRGGARYHEALQVVRAAAARAEASQWPRLVAAAKYAEADLLASTGDYRGAESVLVEAYFLAAGSDVTDVAVDAAELLATTIGVHLARPQEGLRWWRHADLALQTLPDPARSRTVVHLRTRAQLYTTMGRYDDAAAAIEEAVDIKSQELGESHPSTAAGVFELGRAMIRTADYPRARELHERALALRREALGPNHPDVGESVAALGDVDLVEGDYAGALAAYEGAHRMLVDALGERHSSVAASLNNLAIVHQRQGDYGRAEELYARARDIWIEVHGRRHPQVASALLNLATLSVDKGDLDSAVSLARAALEIQEDVFGESHPDLSLALLTLGNAYRFGRDYAASRDVTQRALALLEAKLGSDHPQLAAVVLNLAASQAALGELEQAQKLYERGIGMLERSLGPDHPEVARGLLAFADMHRNNGKFDEAQALYERAATIVDGPTPPGFAYSVYRGLARNALERGQPAEALHHARRSLEMLEHSEEAPVRIAEARFLLARAAWSAGERARARELGEQARDLHREIGDLDRVADIEGWLRHPEP